MEPNPGNEKKTPNTIYQSKVHTHAPQLYITLPTRFRLFQVLRRGCSNSNVKLFEYKKTFLAHGR